jgi:hypothetical protein
MSVSVALLYVCVSCSLMRWSIISFFAWVQLRYGMSYYGAHMLIYVYLSVSVHVCAHACTSVCVYVHVYVYEYLCMHASVHVFLPVCTRACLPYRNCMCMWMHLCTCLCSTCVLVLGSRFPSSHLVSKTISLMLVFTSFLQPLRAVEDGVVLIGCIPT